MTAFDTNRTTYGTASAVSRFFRTISDASLTFTTWNDARLTRNALVGLTDRELEDIGLSRSDISCVAKSNLIR